jgi:hypothetical protein
MMVKIIMVRDAKAQRGNGRGCLYTATPGHLPEKGRINSKFCATGFIASKYLPFYTRPFQLKPCPGFHVSRVLNLSER